MQLPQTIIYLAVITCSLFFNPNGVCAIKKVGFRNYSSSWYLRLRCVGIKYNEDNEFAYPEVIFQFGLGT